MSVVAPRDEKGGGTGRMGRHSAVRVVPPGCLSRQGVLTLLLGGVSAFGGLPVTAI